MSIFQNIKKYCEKENITIAGFEKKCGIGNGTVDDWESSNPSLKSLKKIVEATGIPLYEWIDVNDILDKSN